MRVLDSDLHLHHPSQHNDDESPLPTLPLDERDRLTYSLHPIRSPLVVTPSTPLQQETRRRQERQILLGTRTPHSYSITSPSPLLTPPTNVEVTETGTSLPPSSSGYFSDLPHVLLQLERIETSPIAQLSPSSSIMPSAGNIYAPENSVGIQSALAGAALREPAPAPTQSSTRSGAAAAASGAQANGHATGSSRRREIWREDPGHFRLRSHVPIDERLGTINPWKQFLSSVFEGELHTFFFVFEVVIGVYVAYLGAAQLGIWPVELNYFASYISGLIKGISFGTIIILGAIRFSGYGKTTRSRRKARVATADEEVSMFRIEVAFSLAIYLLILT